MNNIEILEELKARLKLYKKSTDVQFTFTKSNIQAIENLIQENKELKEEKVLNEKIVYIANNTLCNYEEGYQAGLHKEITATAILAEERERFIIGQEITRLKNTIYELHNKLDEGNKRVKEEYIPKSKVKEKIEKLNKEKNEIEQAMNNKLYTHNSSYELDIYKIEALKELLEEGE